MSTQGLQHEARKTLPCGQINPCGQKNPCPKPEKPLSVVRKTLGSDGLPVVKKTLGGQKNPSMLDPAVRKTLEGFSWPQGKVFPTSGMQGQKNPPLRSKKHAVLVVAVVAQIVSCSGRAGGLSGSLRIFR